jgi:hypothetical protein
METKVENLIKELELKERKSKMRSFIFSFVPVVIALLLIYYTSSQVTTSQNKLNSIEKETDSIKKLRDKYQIEYLEAKGFDNVKKNGLLNESIKADNLLTKINLDSIDKSIIIKYYRKSIDQQKVWLSIKELGYENIFDLQSSKEVLKKGETNAVVFDEQVPIFDIKIITLTLIRAGFKIQHFDFSKATKNTVQIIRIAPKDGSPDLNKSITVDEISNIKTTETLVNSTNR